MEQKGPSINSHVPVLDRTLGPGTCKDGTSHDKRDFADVIKSQGLQSGEIILDHLGAPKVIAASLQVTEGGSRSNQRKQCEDESKG